MTAPRPHSRLQGAASDAALQRTVARVVRRHLAAGRAAPGAVTPLADEAARQRLAGLHVPAQGRPLGQVVDELLETVYALRTRTGHPGNHAYFPGPASPLSWLGDLLTALHNPHAGSWQQSVGPSTVEARLVEWLAQQLGLPASAGGLFVSGGSMANLTALAVARDRLLGEATRALGVAYVSGQTHASVARALHLLGLSARQVCQVPVDAAFRLDPAALAAAVTADRAAGRRPFVVIATAGSTNTGSIDPLPALRALCDAEGLWLHVDGAHGASLALSPAHRPLLAGIEGADSVAWDAHKWLFQTYGCGMVLVRDRRHLHDSFHTRADYLRDAEPEGEALNYWDQGPELTRPARALKLWLTLQVLGADALGEAIAHGCRLAAWAQDELQRRPHWQIVSPAQLGIVNVRYAPPGRDEAGLDALNRAISQRVLAEGTRAVLTTRLRGCTVLRLCALHPDATEQDLRETAAALDRHAREALAGAPP